MKTYEITAAAALASISAVLQILHIGWASPWGIWIDLVAVSWIVAYFLYGGRTALVVSLVGAIIITFSAPSTWLGALMKWVSTVPLIFIMILFEKLMRIKVREYSKLKHGIAAVAVAVVLRGLITIPFNYYFAIPIWTGWSPAEAIEMIPWWAIFAINAVQTAIEFSVAWLIVFRFRLNRFSAWE
ncbi:MAG: hypothetical protein JW789_00495 [Candidatus Aenigmarchaeota archaeon]|nr:hypothetical protein [Candidatus Aenigmarchaeota archaeon]